MRNGIPSLKDQSLVSSNLCQKSPVKYKVSFIGYLLLQSRIVCIQSVLELWRNLKCIQNQS